MVTAETDAAAQCCPCQPGAESSGAEPTVSAEFQVGFFKISQYARASYVSTLNAAWP